ncbi:MAG: DUF3302 domain-containing protein [Pseudomonadota bacterium]|nr:DUF3302 domain-containing protein [Pseudomonadota bacterium]
MTGLELFALIVLLVILAAIVAIWVILGMYPGKIARERNHPQADAIAVCGWWGVITMGLLLPVAWIWAYTRPVARTTDQSDAAGVSDRGQKSQGAEGAKS